MARTRQQRLVGILFLAPAILLYTAFVVYPAIQAFAISLSLWTGYTPDREYVGLENYRLVLHDTVFWGAIGNNVRLILIPGLIIMALALYFASTLAQGGKGAQVYRVAYFFPNVMSVVVVAILWSFIYHPDWGIFNGILRAIGLGGMTRAWLAQDTLIPAIYAPTIWMALGFYLVLYLAAIQQIPEELFDASKVDGASGWQTFRHITWPMVWSVNRVCAVFIVLGGLKAFDFIWVFAYGRPALRNHTMATWMYQKTITEYDMGYGTALSVVMFVLVFAASILTFRLASKREREVA
jgi:ABC-type sugar transport system permease subunit